MIISLLVALKDSVASGVPGNLAYDLIKQAWMRINRTSLEDLYLDAFEQALRDHNSRLTAYTQDGDVTLSRDELAAVLHHDLSIDMNEATVSHLDSDAFIGRLAAAMAEHSILIIGGHVLSADDYAQIVRSLIRHATDSFRIAVISNQEAFYTALLNEVQSNRDAVEEAQHASFQQFDLVHEEFRSVQSALAAIASGNGRNSEVGGGRPRHLPRNPDVFTGRAHDLAKTIASLERVGTTNGSSLTGSTPGNNASQTAICAIAGMAGVGKSALAIHAAHMVGERFSDAHLSLDLRGDGGEPVSVAEALVSLLGALGLSSNDIPRSTPDMVGRYRSLLATKFPRTLILLDNAHDASQVEPLIPGHSGCAVLITSRARLDSLDGAEVIELTGMPADEGLTLFGHLAGPARVAAELDDANQIVALCAGLPLALRIAGGTLARKHRWSLSMYARLLADEGRRLELLTLDHLAVRAAFMLSYRDLDNSEARLFRLLGLLTPMRVSSAPAAALTNSTAEVTRLALERLVETQLLESLEQDAYRFHDLVFLFARWRLAEDETDREWRDALRRVTDWYVQMALSMKALMDPNTRQRQAHAVIDALGRPADLDVDPMSLGQGALDSALRWFDTERGNLFVVARGTEDIEAGLAVWWLAAAMVDYLNIRALWREGQEMHERALMVARTNGDLFAISCIGQEHVAQRKDLRHESQAPAFRSGERCRARRATPAARLTPDPDG